MFTSKCSRGIKIVVQHVHRLMPIFPMVYNKLITEPQRWLCSETRWVRPVACIAFVALARLNNDWIPIGDQSMPQEHHPQVNRNRVAKKSSPPTAGKSIVRWLPDAIVIVSVMVNRTILRGSNVVFGCDNLVRRNLALKPAQFTKEY